MLKDSGVYGNVNNSFTLKSCLTDCVVTTMQNVSVKSNTSFASVQNVPTTTRALKQAVTMQPVIVGVDASDWSTNYYYVSIFCLDRCSYMR